MRQKTKYRKECDGWKDFLQYAMQHRFLFFKWETWHYVPKAYYDWIWGRDGSDEERLVNSYDENLNSFVKEWPYIEDYFVELEKEQKILVEKALKKRAEHNAKKNKIEYLS